MNALAKNDSRYVGKGGPKRAIVAKLDLLQVNLSYVLKNERSELVNEVAQDNQPGRKNYRTLRKSTLNFHVVPVLQKNVRLL